MGVIAGWHSLLVGRGRTSSHQRPTIVDNVKCDARTMANLGLLSPEFPSVSLGANLEAIAATGAVSVQFDLVSAVGHTFPIELSQDIVQAIRAGFAERRLTLAALSGTYNMIDPDPQSRALGAEGLNRVIGWAPRLGTHLVTLCTGSRDHGNMWQKHPDNSYTRGVGGSARPNGEGAERRRKIRSNPWRGA